MYSHLLILSIFSSSCCLAQGLARDCKAARSNIRFSKIHNDIEEPNSKIAGMMRKTSTFLAISFIDFWALESSPLCLSGGTEMHHVAVARNLPESTGATGKMRNTGRYRREKADSSYDHYTV